MHYHITEDDRGDMTDLTPFCSDACHQNWCHGKGLDYGGWNGGHEGGDDPEWCQSCGVWAGGEPECEHQRDNAVVNRFRCDGGEKCECGRWVQLPANRLPRYHASDQEG